MLFGGNNLAKQVEADREQRDKTNRPYDITLRLRQNTHDEDVTTNLNQDTTSRDIRYTGNFPTPLYHLRGRETKRYTKIDSMESLDIFSAALELFNRKGVRPMKRPAADDDESEIAPYFFESVGKAKVTPKLCTECRDISKSRKRYDIYYIDLAEISQERNVMCSDCMYKLLKKHIFGREEQIKLELSALRDLQQNGVYIDPFLISCGF